MNRSEAIAFLSEWFDSTPDASPHFEQAVDASRVADVDGRGPVDVGYVETVDGWLAAAWLADLLAARAAMVPSETLTRVTAEGASFEVSQTGPAWPSLAAWFRSRSPLTGGSGMGVIHVERTDHFYPRSAWR